MKFLKKLYSVNFLVNDDLDSATDLECPAEHNKKKMRSIKPFLKELGKSNFEKCRVCSPVGD